MGVPHLGCTCSVCTSTDPRNRRMRTSAVLAVDDQTLLIDTGPDFRTQALANGITHIDAVLLTHSHYDHVAGMDDLRPLTRYGDTMPIYGSPATLRDVRQRFSYAFEDASDGSTRPALELLPVTRRFAIGPTWIVPFDVEHGTWTITGYRFGNLAYATDASGLSVESRRTLQGLDVLVLDALRFRPHPTHFSLAEALAVIEELRPRRTFLVHMNHDIDHASVSAFLPPGVALAYDGLCIEV